MLKGQAAVEVVLSNWSTSLKYGKLHSTPTSAWCQQLRKANPRFMLEVCRASCHICAGDEGIVGSTCVSRLHIHVMLMSVY